MPENTIEGLEMRHEQLKRQPCEVWTRVMGYHRPVTSFNAGKQSEHRQRRFFTAAEEPQSSC